MSEELKRKRTRYSRTMRQANPRQRKRAHLLIVSLVKLTYILCCRAEAQPIFNYTLSQGAREILSAILEIPALPYL